ncbi:hypothetical protein GCM10017783_12410 [Deinococcus piscis]|uniref:G8 domain-containing protein n=1 Tax=Deinococcus piscis TaxID=394230 RepID=A0ABQ3K5F9_9DEIO|nr:G8 domain-containing protein [Deinococcus piscis]GHG01681.1 hypothetical protein GCM10017783_12410 [Deinococcus piscis]
MALRQLLPWSLVLLTALSGCGSPSTPAPNTADTAPDPFTFTAVQGSPPNSEVTSNAVKISGINAPAPIAVAGGTLLLDGQVSTGTTVRNGQSVAVRVRTAAAPAAVASATVTIGGVSGTFTAVTQSGQGTQSAANWSDPATWNGKVPRVGEAVTLPAGKHIILDVSPPALAGLTIPAGSTLEFARKDLRLETEWLMIHGKLQIGTEEQPFAQQAEIVLTNTVPGENVMGMGDRAIGVMDGVLELHGEKRLPWTRLAATAQAGSTVLSLETAPDWQPGDVLTLASTDFNYQQTERAVVTQVSGTQVTLAEPLKYMHWGQNVSYAGKTLHERAEVGLLSHHIRIGASEDASATGLGSHLMLMGQSQARIEGVEFMRGGQRNALRRYPVHFHLLGSAEHSYFRNNSVHDSFNRCVTVHGTSNLRVQDNVTSNSVGHCIFLEDGNETGNTLSGNLVTLVRRPSLELGEEPLLESDRTPTGYWITNPDNTVTNNVAAGVDGTGFWYAFPEHPTGLGASGGASIWPRRTPLGEFSGNVAHSGHRGLNVDDGPTSDGSTTEVVHYNPRSNPADPESAAVPADFTDFVAYKNREHGAWFRGENLTLSGAILADNAIGVTFASHNAGLQRSLLIGETSNVGQPESWEPSGEGGRSLPLPWTADFPIRGFQFYDGEVFVQDTAFAGYRPNSMRKASGLGYLLDNAFALAPTNRAQRLTWLDDSQRVYFPPAQPQRDGDLAATFLDADGSVTGKAGQSVTVSPLLRGQPGCTVRGDWNASICQGQYTRLYIEAVDGMQIAPLTIRQSGGPAVALTGTPEDFTAFYTSVEIGKTYALSAAALPRDLRVSFTARQPGDVLNIQLPYSRAAKPALYRDWWIDERNRLKQVPLSELPRTTGDSYALENGTLHLRLVVRPNQAYATVNVCAAALCE